MSASRKTLLERIRLRALTIHQRNGCTTTEPCTGPTKTEVEQATRHVMRQEAKATS